MASLRTLTTLTVLVSSGIAAPSYDGRIIGGLLAPEHSFPFLVGLSINKSSRSGTFWCGGSLIAPNLVATAAHCVHGGTIDVTVTLGTHERKGNHRSLIQVFSTGITIHEQYNPDTIENDIALIKLPVNVTLTDDIQLIQLASPYMDQKYLQDHVVTTAGWGKTTDHRKGIVKWLRYVDVRVLNQTLCERSYLRGIITANNICVDASDRRGTCSGDSGGPLVYESADGSRYLVGLTSFGSDLGCEKGFPSVFTRVTSFLKWISLHVGVDSSWAMTVD